MRVLQIKDATAAGVTHTVDGTVALCPHTWENATARVTPSAFICSRVDSVKGGAYRNATYGLCGAVCNVLVAKTSTVVSTVATARPRGLPMEGWHQKHPYLRREHI
jgi:hypothetical protein